jgi:PAP2 superfamily C-terminal
MDFPRVGPAIPQSRDRTRSAANQSGVGSAAHSAKCNLALSGVSVLAGHLFCRQWYFFSGHTAIAVLALTELAHSNRHWLTALAVLVVIFEVVTVLALRAHYTMDVFTGIVTALYASYLAGTISTALESSKIRASFLAFVVFCNLSTLRGHGPQNDETGRTFMCSPFPGPQRDAGMRFYCMTRHEFQMTGLHHHRHDQPSLHHRKLIADAEARPAAKRDIASRF